MSKKQEEIKITFKNLNWLLKVIAIYGMLGTLWFIYGFIYGFITA